MAAGISDSILFSAAIVMAIAFIGVFGAVIANAGQDLVQQGDRVSDGLQTEIVIVNDPDAMQTAPLVIYAKNTGSTEIGVQQMAVLLDGVVSSNVTYDVIGQTDDTFWPPGSLLEITVNDLTVSPGEHRVRVITPAGIEDSILFQV